MVEVGSCSSDSTPSLGTSVCSEGSPKKTKRKKKSGSSSESQVERGTQREIPPSSTAAFSLWSRVTFYYSKGMRSLPATATQRCDKLSQQLRQHESGPSAHTPRRRSLKGRQQPVLLLGENRGMCCRRRHPGKQNRTLPAKCRLA